ncbi:MAG: hypothetical protein CMJ18_15710 [Phycisphaeraceae bacterium]|nr:hypothetical protein [Phycisphaeraceae bacterium]
MNPLTEALPLEQAMAKLVQPDRAGAEVIAIVERIVEEPFVAERPALIAGLWLYVDDLERSHGVSQSIDDATGSFWHGIMHRREGDFSNSHYWFGKTGLHAAMSQIECPCIEGGYDGHQFVDLVEAEHLARQASEGLVACQRHEWSTLLNSCARP